jgi:hypothetical protein
MAYSNIGYNANVSASVVATAGNTTNTYATNAQNSNSFTIGNAAGNADRVYDNTRTVTNSSTTDTINLTSAVATDTATLGIQHVTLLALTNLDATNTLTIKAGASNGVTFLTSSGVVCPPGTKLYLINDAVPGGSATAGFAVVASTSDQINVTTSGGSNVQYKLTIFGRDA